MPRPTRITLVVTLVLSGLLFAGALVHHLVTFNSGGLDGALSDAGCFGGVPQNQVGNCDLLRWEYYNWWLIPAGCLLLGLAIAGVLWWVATPARTTVVPGADESDSLW
jgi:hypothetical protein